MKITELEKTQVKKILDDWKNIKGVQLQTDVKFLATELLKAWGYIEDLQQRDQNLAISVAFGKTI